MKAFPESTLVDLPFNTDPFFYLVSVPAVLLLGISKSGFGAGLGSLAVPMMALAAAAMPAKLVVPAKPYTSDEPYSSMHDDKAPSTKYFIAASVEIEETEPQLLEEATA